jgi:hypothetical protein
MNSRIIAHYRLFMHVKAGRRLSVSPFVQRALSASAGKSAPVLFCFSNIYFQETFSGEVGCTFPFQQYIFLFISNSRRQKTTKVASVPAAFISVIFHFLAVSRKATL